MDKKLLTKTQFINRTNNIYYRKAVSYLCNNVSESYKNHKFFTVGGINIIKPYNPEYE